MSTTFETKWLTWGRLPELLEEPHGGTVQLCDRLLSEAAEAESRERFLERLLPDVAAEFGAQWAGVLDRTPTWQPIGDFGRRPAETLPTDLLQEALDREAAGAAEAAAPAGWSQMAVPLPNSGLTGAVLLLAGRGIDRHQLPAAVAVGRVLGLGLRLTEELAGDRRRIGALQETLRAASSFSSMRETRPLLELIAAEATRLLDCDRSSIFIWDRERKEVVACPALGVEGGVLRIPDGSGVVGTAIHAGKTIRVDDAYDDPRFDSSVDEASGYKTRNLLCVPLRDADETIIGAFEVINKHAGHFVEADEEILAHLGVQAAVALRNAREHEDLIRSREQLTEQVTQGVQIVGESAAIVALRETVVRLAQTDLPVLILGESGTGKEVVAQALHYGGTRSGHPFVAVNCAALTDSLLESELFGHEKGAFTGADEARPGKFELADGGTLFLDEIGDMSLDGQATLLRALEQKVVTRVRGSESIPVDVRVVAATNADLGEAVREKRFRQDLFYRLNMVQIDLPPLRERPEDILVLTEFFLGQFCRKKGRPKLKVSDEARRRLQAHGWPGNVRELRNLMERVAFLAQGDRVEVDDLAFVLSPDRDSALEPSLELGLNEATKRFQRDYILRAIRRVRNNMSEAAKLLGLHRSNLYRKMRQLDMDTSGSEDE